MDDYQITWKLHSHEAFLLFQLMGMNRVLGYTDLESDDSLKIIKANTDSFYVMLYEFEKSLLVRPGGSSMNQSHEDLLPIGSVVVLKEGVKKLMIYGRKQLLLQEENPTMYDYVACYYPEGHINPDHTFVFNHGDIQDVVFKGFKNEEEDRFLELLHSK